VTLAFHYFSAGGGLKYFLRPGLQLRVEGMRVVPIAGPEPVILHPGAPQRHLRMRWLSGKCSGLNHRRCNVTELPIAVLTLCFKEIKCLGAGNLMLIHQYA